MHEDIAPEDFTRKNMTIDQSKFHDEWNVTPPLVKEAFLALYREGAQEESARQQERLLRESIKVCAHQCAAIAARRTRTKRQAVFICDSPSTRQAKLAFGLRSYGWEVILLHRNLPSFDAARYFDEIVQYTTEHHAATLASVYAPTVYHVFSSWDFKTSRAIIDARPGKVVFDSYDCFAGGIQKGFEHQIGTGIVDEKYCFEHADATCHRAASSHARRKLGYNMAKPIFFPEYSWGEGQNLGLRKKPKRTDGIHCVYVGSIQPADFTDPSKRTNVYDTEFVHSLTSRGVHYHIFPYTNSNDLGQFARECSALLDEQAGNKFFHFHPPYPYETMMEEISQFHFGVVTVSPEIPVVGNHFYTARSFRNTTINKAFDYIDAGLFFLSCGLKTLERVMGDACEVVPRLEVGEYVSKITPEEYNNKLLPRLPAAIKRLSVVKHAERLARFYESL